MSSMNQIRTSNKYVWCGLIYNMLILMFACYCTLLSISKAIATDGGQDRALEREEIEEKMEQYPIVGCSIRLQ